MLIHDCGNNKTFQKTTNNFQEGYATLIGNSSKITFENNILINNFRGFMAYTSQVNATNNTITQTLQYSPLWCENCSYSEFSFNYLADNGNPENFWFPGVRSIGIWIKKSNNVKIHDNKIIRSTSDGIAITGQVYAPLFHAQCNSKPAIPSSRLDRNIAQYRNL